MSRGCEDYEIFVERAGGGGWLWAVGRHADRTVYAFGHSPISRAAACGDAAMAVFRLLGAGRDDPGDRSPERVTAEPGN